MLKKIVVIGPESTGKSTLSQQLAEHYDTVWVPEYARQFLLERGPRYNYDDLLFIAKSQLELEDKIVPFARNGLLFIDTNMYVMEVWCEFVFGRCHSYILDELSARLYDLYLLCNIDLPWVKDELREYPDLETRLRLFKLYEKKMQNQQVPWIEISGNYEQRLTLAINAVDKLIEKSSSA
jgi:NadR type nicotinamide-nucleotide adenylyltransferase